MRTNKEIKIRFKDQDITIPKGTKVTNQTAMGYDPKVFFIDEFEWLKNSMLRHDAEYYGISIDKKDVK